MLKPEARAIMKMRAPAYFRALPTDLASPLVAAFIPVFALAAIIDQITTERPLNIYDIPLEVDSKLSCEALSLP